MKTTLLVLVLFGAACDLGEVDAMDIMFSDLAAKKDPCLNPELKKKINVHADKDNPHRFVGTEGDDVIFGTSGDDVIFGLGGDDIICAGDGDDYVDGGGGKDYIYGGAGDDVIHGRGGSDWIWGGAGDDVIFGDILDDHLFGEDGDDVLIGGHGTDELDGGAGDDFMRGDTGNDSFTGGDGYNIVSFATALPPGQTEFLANGQPSTITGMKIEFGVTKCGGEGCADGDGGNEKLSGIDEIIGSSFVDDITSNGRVVHSGYGPDTLDGATVGAAAPANAVFIDAANDHKGRLVDVGVVVMGSTADDDITIKGNGDIVFVNANHPMTAIAPCEQNGAPNAVKCDVGAFIASKPHRPAPFPSPFHYIVGWGDAGDDTFELTGTFPREFEASVSGGPGNDHLIGGDEQDIFFTGTDGNDHLEGNGGDDALIGESHHSALWDSGDRPKVADYHDGADIFDGGDGDDQLVVDYVCGGHTYIGGKGHDIAGFARSGNHPIHAQLHGPSSYKSDWYGFAANLDLCPDKKDWTVFKYQGDAADLEVLEASDGADYLWGDDNNNTIWGRGGGDHIWGLGGDDTILGADGRDVIDGGSGNNTISRGDQNPD